MSESGIVYLGLCVRYEPPIIGIHYKTKASDSKKKVYTILLQKLVLHPYPDEAAEQLYRQHPHILREDKIPKKKIAALIAKIQQQLHIGQEHEEDYYGQEFEQSEEKEQPKPKVTNPPKEAIPEIPKRRPNFNMDAFDSDHPLNRSL